MTIKHSLLRLQFGVTARIRFYEKMRDLIRDGIGMYEAMRGMEQAAVQFKIFPVEVLRSMMSSMRGSHRSQDASLGAALAPWVPPMEAALIAAGERSGKVDVGLHEAAQLMAMQKRMRALLLGKLSYPVMLVFMLTGLLYALGAFLMPMLANMLPRAKWTGPALVMGFMADHSVTLTFSVMGCLVGFAAVFTATMHRWTGASRDFFDRYVPPWTLYRRMQGSMVLTTLAMLMSAGVPIASATDLIRKNGTPWVAEHMARILLRMRSGQSDGQAIAGTGARGTLFDAYTAWELGLYNANSTMASKMRSLAGNSSSRVETSIGTTASIAKGLVMVTVAILLTLTYVSYMTVSMNAGGGGSGL